MKQTKTIQLENMSVKSIIEGAKVIQKEYPKAKIEDMSVECWFGSRLSWKSKEKKEKKEK